MGLWCQFELVEGAKELGEVKGSTLSTQRRGLSHYSVMGCLGGSRSCDAERRMQLGKALDLSSLQHTTFGQRRT